MFEPPEDAVVVSILRAAHALDFINFRTWAVRLIAQRWSSKMDTLKTTCAILYSKQVLDDPCAMIRLARDCEVPSVLPRAFYELVRLPSDNWGPITLEDFTTAMTIQRELTRQWLAFVALPPKAESSKKRCLLAWMGKMGGAAGIAAAWTHDPILGLDELIEWTQQDLIDPCLACASTWKTASEQAKMQMWSTVTDLARS